MGKFWTVFLLLVFSSGLNAYANTSNEGHYFLPHRIYFNGYPNQTACEKDNFKWVDGHCFSEGEDSVDIKVSNNKIEVVVSTVVNNGNSCDFSGVASSVGPGEIRAVEEVASPCVVLLNFADGNTVSVTNNGQCSNDCGNNASLDIGEARKDWKLR